jgi:DNA-binding NarL/FixJ family response regulator
MNLGASESIAVGKGLESDTRGPKQPANVSGRWSPKSSPVKTLLVDGCPAMLETLSRILAQERGFEIVGSATDGRKALIAAAALNPELVLMALHLPHLNGPQTTRCLKEFEHPPVVFLLAPNDDGASSNLIANAGADALVIENGELQAHLHSKLQEWFGPEPASAKNAKSSNPGTADNQCRKCRRGACGA